MVGRQTRRTNAVLSLAASGQKYWYHGSIRSNVLLYFTDCRRLGFNGVKLVVAAVGRLKSGPERELQSRYCERVSKQGRDLHFSQLQLIELAEGRAPSVAMRKDDEARRLLGATDTLQLRAALDENGCQLSSQGFANWLARQRDDGISTLGFLIGGPDGHGEELLTTCQVRLTLGSMTFSHGIARIILLEQIYRACTILAGHPYHRN